VPRLLERVRPIHSCIEVDYFLPGCPPPADAIWHVLNELIEGRQPNPLSVSRFGA
jgi:NAD-reducing hydrogenase small subunit